MKSNKKTIIVAIFASNFQNIEISTSNFELPAVKYVCLGLRTQKGGADP